MRPASVTFAVAAIVIFAASFSMAASADSGNDQSLRERLLSLAEERLRPAGLFVDREHVWMSASESLPANGEYEIRATWVVDGSRPPPLPLTFELRARAGFDHSDTYIYERAASPPVPIEVTLAVSLQREVWVATRRLRKGSTVTCGDLGLQRRRIERTSQSTLPTPCEIGADVVVLRDLLRGDVIRPVDIGTAPDVIAGATVRVNLAAGGIRITAEAIALGDANIGDQIEVRLQRPTRTLRTRVVAPGTVQLAEVSR